MHTTHASEPELELVLGFEAGAKHGVGGRFGAGVGAGAGTLSLAKAEPKAREGTGIERGGEGRRGGQNREATREKGGEEKGREGFTLLVPAMFTHFFENLSDAGVVVRKCSCDVSPFFLFQTRFPFPC